MNLSFMDTETTSQIYARVSRRVEQLTFQKQTFTEEQEAEYAYLCEVEQALETIGGFLNGEYREFCEQRDSRRSNSEREVFNTP